MSHTWRRLLAFLVIAVMVTLGLMIAKHMEGRAQAQTVSSQVQWLGQIDVINSDGSETVEVPAQPVIGIPQPPPGD